MAAMVAIIASRTIGPANARACTSVAPCAVRAISSSVRVRRGISIGQGSAAGAGAGAGTAIGTGSGVGIGSASSAAGETFSALRRQLREVKEDAKSDGQAGKKHADRPQTSAQARLQTIQQDKQVDKTKGEQPEPSLAAASAVRQATPLQTKERKTPAAPAAPSQEQDDSWGALTRRIEQARLGKTNEASASKLSVSANASQSKRGKPSAPQIDSIPLWGVSVHGVRRSFAFTSAIKARMFLQGASSALLIEDGWVGTLSLQRGSQAHAKETVEVVLAGSRPSGEEGSAVDDALATSSVSEHDISLAESLDALYASLSRPASSAKGTGKSVAFSNSAEQSSFSTASVLESTDAAQTDRMEERVPVNVTGSE